MKTIKVKDSSEIPENYTGIAEWPDGTKEWLKGGKPHREDGPACEYTDGGKHWYKDGEQHRLEGPAVEQSDGSKLWYKDGDRHREDGPACEYADGYKEWYLNNVCYKQIFLGDNVILDSYQGEYNLIWYKLLGKYKVFEYPDIPGLIIK
jgi:hypothetical protein